MWIRSTIASLLLVIPALAGAADFSQSVPVQAGGRLEIDLDSGDLEIEVHDLEEVHVDAYATGGLLGSTRFELRSDGVDAEFKSKGGGWLFGGSRVRVRVRVPQRYSIDAKTRGGNVEIAALEGEVSAETSGGKIELDGARGDVELKTSGGPIRVANVQGDLEVRTSGGVIQVSEVKGEIDVETSGGAIGVYDVMGAVKARTSGGRIEVRFLGLPEGELRTSGGSIRAELPGGVGVDLEAETSGGRVEMDDELRVLGEIRSDRVSGQINGGGPKLELRTSGGNILVRVR